MDFRALAYYIIIHDFFAIYKEFDEFSPAFHFAVPVSWFKLKKMPPTSPFSIGIVQKIHAFLLTKALQLCYDKV